MRKSLCAAAVAAATALVVPIGLAPVEAAARYSVTAFASSTSITLGQKLALRGKVSPNAKGTTVAVQVRTPGATAWRTVKRVRLTRTSRYVAVVVPPRAGPVSYRVLKPRGAGRAAGVSPVRTVTVSRWRTLSSMPTTSSTATTVVPSVVLGQNTYRPAIRQGVGSSAVYVLGGVCSRFDGFVGADPASVDAGPFSSHAFASLPGAPGSFTEQVAENRVFPGEDPHHIVRGPSTMSGLYALNLSANAFGEGNAVMWSARVYCAS